MASPDDPNNVERSTSSVVHPHFFEVLWRVVALAQWNVERINDKAKATLGTGATTLSILVIAIVGFATILDGDLANLAPLTQLPLWAQNLIYGCVFLGVVFILLSVGFATMSLRTFQVYDPVVYEDFTKHRTGDGEIDIDILKKYSAMPPNVVSAIQEAYIRRLRELGANIDNISRHLHRSQRLLLFGLTAIGTSLLLILGNLLAISIFGT